MSEKKRPFEKLPATLKKALQEEYLATLEKTGLVAYSAGRIDRRDSTINFWRKEDPEFDARCEIAMLKGRSQYSKVVHEAATGTQRFMSELPDARLAMKLAEKFDDELKPATAAGGAFNIDKAVINYVTNIPLPTRIEDLPEEQ